MIFKYLRYLLILNSNWKNDQVFCFIYFSNYNKAQYDDLLIDNGINSDPLLSEKNEIMIIKRKIIFNEYKYWINNSE